jgi:hypothetical protein
VGERVLGTALVVEAGQRWRHERTGDAVTVLRIDYPDNVRVDSNGTERGITRKTLRRNYTQEATDE